MKNITVLVLEGVMDSSLAITLDVLQAARRLSSSASGAPRIRIETIAASAKVSTASGLCLAVDTTLKNAVPGSPASQWIIVPGLGLMSDEAVASRFARPDAIKAIGWLRNAAMGKASIAASCTGVFLLAEGGLLAGRRATTTWWLGQAFRARYPDVVLDDTRMLVRDGKYLTAGAALSQLDVMLAVVTDVMGASIAHLCSRYMLIDKRSSQARYMMREHLLHQDPTVIAAERWIDAHLAQPISVNALASELAVSSKTLARRIASATGISPIRFIQRRRLGQAVHLIETTTLSIEEVAAQVGYVDSTALRKLIKREFGVTPSMLR